MTETLTCIECLEPYPLARFKALQPAVSCHYCIECADNLPPPVRTVAHINKSNPMLVTDMETLKQLNPKRT